MEKVLENIRKIIHTGNLVCYIIAGVACVLMVLNVLCSAFCTWIFNVAFPIPVDVTGILLLISICFAYPSFQYKNGFVRVDILTHNMQGRMRQVFEIISLAFTLFFYVLCVYSIWGLFEGYFTTKQRLSTIAIPIWPFALCLLVSMAWATIVTAFQVCETVRGGALTAIESDIENKEGM